MDSKKTNLKKIGNEKFEKKDYKGAIEDSSKVIELDPQIKTHTLLEAKQNIYYKIIKVLLKIFQN